MGKEIERKFLVNDCSFKEMATKRHEISQAYLSKAPEATVRVRIKDDKAFLTVKGRNTGAERSEWEFAIPASEAADMIAQLPLGGVIRKTRHLVPYDGHTWEVDEFHGAHEGLTVAEIELDDTDETFALPGFVKREVTDDPRYYNSSLADSPTPPCE